MLNLDTHILIFALLGEVSAKESRLLSQNQWGVSAIVLWELAKLSQLRRITLDVDSPDVVRLLSSIHVWPIDLAVSMQSTRLDFSSDPADELIAATSVIHRAPLITRDRRILKSKIVPFA